MEIKWGLVPDMGGIALMRQLARERHRPRAHLHRPHFSGEEALRYGFATAVHADPLEAARATAREIADKSPDAVRALKRLLNASTDLDTAAILIAESREQAQIIGAPNQVEAIRAGVERRAAEFIDRRSTFPSPRKSGEKVAAQRPDEGRGGSPDRRARATKDLTVRSRLSPSAGSAFGRRHDDRRPPPRTVRRRRRTAGPKDPRRQFRRPPSAAERPRGAGSRPIAATSAYDAPCQQACPTSIDIPLFIRQIAAGNRTGSAKTIFDANIMGGMCARVCPTETLCEEACVREAAEGKPVRIGLLQRYATDALIDTGQSPYTRAAPTGKRVAIVGAGPAGLACAHALAVAGVEVTIFEARMKPGGLNEYGIAAYKTVDDFAAKEAAFVLSVGGIEAQYGVALGAHVKLDELRRDYDAVFLAMGLGATNKLGLPGEGELENVADAVDYIAALRQAEDLTALPVGRRVVVIGGGMTAIDIAVQSKKLGAQNVTIVYRRSEDQMKASRFERELAQTSGVVIRTWARPVAIEGHAGAAQRRAVRGHARARGRARFARLRLPHRGRHAVHRHRPARRAGRRSTGAGIELKGGRIVVDGERRTSAAGVWAGGDCVLGGEDLTVSAVEDGKQAAALDRRRARRRRRLNLDSEAPMADLSTNFLGIKSPNPFWLASAPPTDRKVNVERAFRAGWGGVVWKTLGEAGPPVVNVSGARYGAIHGPDRRVLALNNIELITDRDLEINLQEIKEVKRAWPDRALVVSLMVPCDEESWKAILARVEETECDGVELNFGCPHGMSERGMGSAVGQVPEYVEMVARWCKAATRACR